MSLPVSPDIDSAHQAEQRTYRIVLVDGHCLFRQALRVLLLATESDFVVVGEAGRADEALALIDSTQPDLVLTDLYLPDGSGAPFIEQLHARFPKLVTLVLTAVRARGAAAAARKAGALGYVLKDQGRDELSAALREVVAGRWYSAEVPAVTRRARGIEAGSSSARAAYLTDRQRQVLRSVALGHSTREIASALGVSVRAVHKQRERLRISLQLNSTAALTRFALREGLLEEIPASS